MRKQKLKHLLILIVSIQSTFSSFAQTKSIELDDIWKYYRFYAKGVDGFTGMADGTSYAAFGNENGQSIDRFSFQSGKLEATLISASEHPELSDGIDEFTFSPDEEGILITTQTEKIYRHSSKAINYIYHRPNSSLHKLSEKPIRNAVFSPVEDKVAFSMENNLYVKDLKSDQLIEITNDGSWNGIINGTPDWVYEEEFSFDRAFEWSPNGKHIAFLKFNESAVKSFSMDIYGKELYPSRDEFKYPKAGEDNSEISLWVYSIDGASKQLKLPKEFEYIPRMYWTDNNELVVLLLNRLQNEMNLIQFNSDFSESTILYTEKDAAYLELPEVLHFTVKGDFLINSDKSGTNQLYLCNQKECKAITPVDLELTSFYGFDEKKKIFYFQATSPELAHQRSIYSGTLKGKTKLISTQDGWNDAIFNPQLTYFVHSFQNATTPPIYDLIEVNKFKKIRNLEDNALLKSTIDGYKMGTKSFFKAEINGNALSAWIIKPTDFDPTKKYPVLTFVYGGPGSQTVKDEYDAFNGMWYQMLADKGYIVASVDNRGTGVRGRDFKKCTYGQLGKLEIEDQIGFAKYLGSLSYIDSNRIGIWGWSYGGYMSSLGLTKGADVYSTAIAVAPVTNWRFYDNIYTERYMGLPQDNGSGYDENSPINHTSKMKGNYLLVHGSADDNVHVQNSMRMTQALINSNVDFEQFIYPDKNHGIYGGNTRLHLYKKMTQFLLNNL